MLKSNANAENESILRKKRIYFSAEKDIVLLKLVVKHNPFAFGNQIWERISQSLKKRNFMVACRSARDRCNHLIYIYNQKQLNSINKTGTEELFKEREELIADVISLKNSQQQIVTVLGYNPNEKKGSELSQQSDSSDSSSPMSPAIVTSGADKDDNKLVSDEEWKKTKRKIDELMDSYSNDKYKDEMIKKRLEMDLTIRKQELELKKMETEVEVMKKRILEEDMQLKNKELEMKRLSTEAEISRKEKELNLEEKRLKLEETKVEQAGAFQQQLLEQQKIIMHLLTKLTEK